MSKKPTTAESKTGMLGSCLICGTRGTESAPIRRGICPAHYMQFTRTIAGLPADKRQEYEDELIAKKLILPSRIGRPSEDNPFAEVAEKYLPERDRKAIEAGRRASAKLIEDQQKKEGRK